MEEAANMKKRIAHEKQVMQASATGYSPLTESTPPERKPFIDVSKPALRIGEYVSVRNDTVQGQVSGHYYHYHHYLHYHYYHHIKKMMKGVLVKQVERI